MNNLQLTIKLKLKLDDLYNAKTKLNIEINKIREKLSESKDSTLKLYVGRYYMYHNNDYDNYESYVCKMIDYKFNQYSDTMHLHLNKMDCGGSLYETFHTTDNIAGLIEISEEEYMVVKNAYIKAQEYHELISQLENKITDYFSALYKDKS